MIISNFLRNRKSVREFKKKKVDVKTLDTIQDKIQELKDEINNPDLDFKLFEKGEIIYSAFENKGGYAGVMIESPHYLVLDFKNREKETLIRGAYYLEKIITEINNLGVSTCWITVPDLDEASKREIFGEEVGDVRFLLGLGYEKLRNPFEPEPYSERINVEELVYRDEIGRISKVEDLENQGILDIFYYVRYAPSNKNLQPWRFLLVEDRLQLLLEYKVWTEELLIDAGIIMYYFDKLAHTQARYNEWKLMDKMEEIQVGDMNYRYIAEYRL